MPLKSTLDDLAVFGGTPAFDEPLHVGRPNVGDRGKFEERVADILDRRWLTNGGRYVGEFENRLADLVAVKHCIAMCNATVALEIAIRALDLSGEVIVPSFTFVATAHALQWQQITPVFADVDAKTHNLDPASVEAMITPRTTGIIAVHLWGRACDIDALNAIARRHNLRQLFDAAHALGCSHQARMIGSFGDAEVFSFHATKFVNSLEGGAVVTNNDELARKLRLMKNFGFTSYDRVDFIGTNGKMNEISAAMGLTNLESMDEFIAVNANNYEHYRGGLKGIAGVRLITFDETERNNYQYVVIEVDEELAGINRDELQKVLWAENILARRYFYPGCHRVEPYRSYFPHARLLLPETVALVKRVLTLPTGTAVGAEEIASICRMIRLAISQGHDIHERFLRRESIRAASATLDGRTVR